MLIGLGKMVKKIVSSALRTLLYTYTTTGTPGTQGGSYYTTYVGSESTGYVAISTGGKIIYSSDLITWTESSVDLGNWGWNTPVYDGTKFVAVASYGKTAYSFDGLSWTLGPTLANTVTTRYPAYGNGSHVVLADGGSEIFHSSDGISWTNIGVNLNVVAGFGNDRNFGTLGFINNKFIAPGYTSIAYSSDGITWAATAVPAQSNFQLIGYANNTIIVGQYTSTDGINWSYNSNIPNFSKIVYANGVYIGIGEGTTNVYAVYRSTDLNTWTLVLDIANADPTDVIVVNDKFIAYVGNSIYSSNLAGDEWAMSVTIGDLGIPLYNGLLSRSSLSFIDGVITVASEYGYASYSSLDGVTWQAHNFSTSLYQLLKPAKGKISTLREVQTVIGGQGEEGSFVESLSPVFLYDINTIGYIPGTFNTLIHITAQNNGTTNEYVTVGLSYDDGATISLGDPLTYKEDILVPAGETVDIWNDTRSFVHDFEHDMYAMATKANVITFRVLGN
jgi:hypothetical protein